MRTVSLGDLCDMQSGGTPRRGSTEFYGGKIPWAKIGDLASHDGVVRETEEQITQEGLEAIGGRIFPPGTLLLAMYGSVGKTAIAGCEMSTNQAILGIRPRNESELDCSFLRRWLNHIQPALISSARGVAQANISKSIVANLDIPLIPISAQRKIAAILDKADAIRRKRQEAIALTEQLLRSTFLEMFGDPVTNPKGWPVRLLREIALVTGGLQVTEKRSALPVEVPYLRVANVYRDELNLKEIKLIKVTEKELGRAQLTAGDILIVEGHGNADEIGRAALWDGSITPCVHQNHLIRVSANQQAVHPDYLNAFVNSAGGRRHMQRMGKTTSGLNTISTENVRSMEILLLPLELQNRFANRICSTRSFLQNQRDVFACSEELFNSLVQRAFTGQL